MTYDSRQFATGFRWLCGGGVVVVGAALGLDVLKFLFADVVEDHRHRRRFDAALWRSHQEVEHDTHWPPRLCMVDDLLRSRRLEGLSSNQVVSLLGPPEERGFPPGAADCHLHYFLGPERGFIRIDSEWLFLTLDANQRVSRCWIHRD